MNCHDQGRASLASLNATRRVFRLPELEEMPQVDDSSLSVLAECVLAAIAVGCGLLAVIAFF